MSLTFRGCVGCGIKRIRCPPGNTPRIVPAADISSETLLTLLPPPTPLPASLPYLSSRLGILAGRNFQALIRIRTQGRAPVCTYLLFPPYARLTTPSPTRRDCLETLQPNVTYLCKDRPRRQQIFSTRCRALHSSNCQALQFFVALVISFFNCSLQGY